MDNTKSRADLGDNRGIQSSPRHRFCEGKARGPKGNSVLCLGRVCSGPLAFLAPSFRPQTNLYAYHSQKKKKKTVRIRQKSAGFTQQVSFVLFHSSMLGSRKVWSGPAAPAACTQYHRCPSCRGAAPVGQRKLATPCKEDIEQDPALIQPIGHSSVDEK